MTRFDPSLIVQRVVISKDGRAVYDEQFHIGVNVIRGDNSSGKSTILNFIYYGLGGDLTEWSEVALLCSRVFVQVRLSGIVATLSREVSAQSGMPMEIFGGPYEDALTVPRDAWKRYPYRRTPNQESFSQAIFRLLGMPEASSDTTGNITIHQILRLLYADQLGNVEDLFRFERFDQASLRDTVGRLLCGAYASKLYSNEQRIKVLDREFIAVQAELRSLIAVLGKTDHVPTLDWITSTGEETRQRLASVYSQIDEVERELFTSGESNQLTLDAQNKAYVVVQQLQSQIAEVQAERDAMAFNIADSDAFITSLENKVAALKDAASVSTYFGDIRFQSCPACYAILDSGSEVGEHACHLCKSPFDAEFLHNRIASLINENAIQIKQSRLLQIRRRERASRLEERLLELKNQWAHASKRLSAIQRLPSSDLRHTLRELQRQTGYIERQLEDLDREAATVRLIGELIKKKEQLNNEMNALIEDNKILVFNQSKQLSLAYTLIADRIRLLLRLDLRRQDSFENPQSINFTFTDNKITVDGHSYFSASSRAILKSSFCVGFMAAAATAPFFRHPRFCMIDVLENMGVETIRSQNFQRQIAFISSELKAEHQIIYATAMIAPELEDVDYTVGRFSTRDEPTLAIAK